MEIPLPLRSLLRVFAAVRVQELELLLDHLPDAIGNANLYLLDLYA